MIYDYEKVTARTREVVAADPDYIYDRGPAGEKYAECRYYESVPLLDGKDLPIGFDDEDLLAELIAGDRISYRRGEPSCLIAQVLDPWLTDEQRDYVFRVYNTETITNGLYDWLVGERVLVSDFTTAAWLRAAQEAQDRKEPWGECLAAADQMIADAIADTHEHMHVSIKKLMGDRL